MRIHTCGCCNCVGLQQEANFDPGVDGWTKIETYKNFRNYLGYPKKIKSFAAYTRDFDF